MNARALLFSVITVWLSSIVLPFAAQATSNYDYKPDEYVTIVDGRSPDDTMLWLHMARGHDRHVAMMIRYRIEHRRAYLISGPTQVEKMPND